MVTVYTHSWNLVAMGFWKWVARKVVGKFSGPEAVAMSVVRGFRAEGIPFLYNPVWEYSDTAIVLASPDVLRRAIARKNNGQIKKLIAGPNVVAHPFDSDRIMLDVAIDTIIVPSEWVATYWKQEAPEIAEKIAVWPAGVDRAAASDRSGFVIIYDKMGDAKLNEWITETLEEQNIPYVVYTYGNFKQKDYLLALVHAPFLLYLSKSESQGLAIQEAWARNVPTFVIQSSAGAFDNHLFIADKINAPHMTEDTGVFFSDKNELIVAIKKLHTFAPKKYCDEHLSDTASFSILKSIYEKNN